MSKECTKEQREAILEIRLKIINIIQVYDATLSGNALMGLIIQMSSVPKDVFFEAMTTLWDLVKEITEDEK